MPFEWLVASVSVFDADVPLYYLLSAVFLLVALLPRKSRKGTILSQLPSILSEWMTRGILVFLSGLIVTVVDLYNLDKVDPLVSLIAHSITGLFAVGIALWLVTGRPKFLMRGGR